MSSPEGAAALVYRGQTVESVHHAHVACGLAGGARTGSFGQPDLVTFSRSALKPFQLAPLLMSGAADHFGFTREELAIMCASHNGEAAHVKTVTGILEKVGIGVEALRCGAHAPYHAPTAAALAGAFTPLHNNCSGKHAGMLALAKFLGAPLEAYLAPDHPVQREILGVVAQVTGLAPSDLRAGTDGCSAPNYAMPLSALARAFAHLARPDEVGGKLEGALTRARDAMLAHPYFVGGTDRFDTQLMESADGRLVAKAGGEGVQAVADVETGQGLAIKIEDGNSRARDPVTIEALRQLGWLDTRAFEVLGEAWRPTLRNHQGLVVGRIEPVLRLHTGSA